MNDQAYSREYKIQDICFGNENVRACRGNLFIESKQRNMPTAGV